MLTSLILRLSDDNPLVKEEDYQKVEDTTNILINEIKMLLTSRVRIIGVENIQLVNQSILNYGFDESLFNVNELNARRAVIESRLKNMLVRFEPRLTDISICSNVTDGNILIFNISANYLRNQLFLELKWDDYTGVFYLNE